MSLSMCMHKDINNKPDNLSSTDYPPTPIPDIRFHSASPSRHFPQGLRNVDFANSILQG